MMDERAMIMRFVCCACAFSVQTTKNNICVYRTHYFQLNSSTAKNRLAFNQDNLFGVPLIKKSLIFSIYLCVSVCCM